MATLAFTQFIHVELIFRVYSVKMRELKPKSDVESSAKKYKLESIFDWSYPNLRYLRSRALD